jgi:predicted ATPase
LLSAESWQHQYDLTLALSLEAMDTAYLAGDFDTTYRLCETILQQSPTLQDHVHVYETRISAGFAQNRLAETVQIALDALRLLGVTLPEQPDEHDIVATFEETRAMLADWTMEELLNLPPMTDEQLLAAMRIMVSMYAAVYNMGSPLLPLLTFRGVSLSVRSGNAPDSAYFYAFYGLLLLNMLQDIDAGYTFGELAMRLIAQHDQYKYKARTIQIVTFFLRHWKEHWPDVQPTFLEVYRSGLEMGDVEYAALYEIRLDRRGYGACGHHQKDVAALIRSGSCCKTRQRASWACSRSANVAKWRLTSASSLKRQSRSAGCNSGEWDGK